MNIPELVNEARLLWKEEYGNKSLSDDIIRSLATRIVDRYPSIGRPEYYINSIHKIIKSPIIKDKNTSDGDYLTEEETKEFFSELKEMLS